MTSINMPEILEAALFAAGEPLSVEKLSMLFEEANRPALKEIREHLMQLAEFYQNRGVELVEVASGFRFQARSAYAPWLQRLWEQKPPRYGRAFLETLALIVYQQPITRGEIEEVRGVAVNTHIIKVLTERNWIKIVGHKDVPGKPALYGSTKEFLDYFNCKSLSELPTLSDLANLDELEKQLNAQMSFNLDGQENSESIESENETINEAEVEISEDLYIEAEAVITDSENSDEAPENENAEISALIEDDHKLNEPIRTQENSIEHHTDDSENKALHRIPELV